MSLLLKYPLLKTIQTLSLRRKVSVFLVGGFLRDQFLNRSGTDFDFAVSKDAISLARAFSKTVKGAFVLLDEEHPCARVVKHEQDRIWTFDFSDFRAATLPKDLKLRDFTINTLCLNLNAAEDKVMDQEGALKDLKAKTIKMVAVRAFKDDPLRLMRAFSLMAQLGFKIEPKTLSQIKKEASLIQKVSVERIREELFKVLSSPRAFETLTLMDKLGLLEKIMTQLGIMRGCFQGGYHHLDVWKHTLEVVNQFEQLTLSFPRKRESRVLAKSGSPIKTFGDDNRFEFIPNFLNEEIGGGHARYALLKLACLLHDIGKPETKKKEKDRMSFHSHEHVGADITRHIAKHLKVSTKERYFLEDMVRWHLRPGYLSNFKKPSERMVFRFLRDTKEEALSVLLLAMADQAATRGPLTTKAKADHHRKICLQVMNQCLEKNNKKPLVRLITGNDLIKKLRLEPSALFAKILTEIQEAQALGKITTKTEALALARKIAKV